MFNKQRGLLGLIVSGTVVVVLAGTVAVAGASSAGRTGMRHRYSIQGLVTSVNNVAAADTCGTLTVTADVPFSFVGGRHGIMTVEVTPATTFTNPGLASPESPSFADVCVGTRVEVQGTFSAGTFTARSVAVLPPPATGAHGIVTSIGTVATAGTCGSATVTGTAFFTLVGGGRFAIRTVAVTTATTFADPAVTSPATASFADVCIGTRVEALGTFAAGTLTATSVAVVPPPLVQARGVVTSVNSVSTAGTCGTSGATVPFTLVGPGRRAITTVDVTSATTFTDPAVGSSAAPSYAEVCVGTRVEALGTFAAGTLTATSVAVVPPPTFGVQGIVTSVNGVSTAGTCGVADTAGYFALAGMHQNVGTVDVTLTTTFTDPAVALPTLPSFTDVCVGTHVRALVTAATGTFTATSVAVLPPSHLSGGHRNLRGNPRG